MTPYEEEELGLGVRTYAQKKTRALEIFARLRTLRNEVGIELRTWMCGCLMGILI